jgi:hypothetical protein
MRMLTIAGEIMARLRKDRQQVDNAHEALFRSWGRLVRWVEQSAEALRLRHDIRNASHSWDQGGRADEDLWRGGRLARARELIEGGDLALEDLDRAFADASSRAERAQAEAEEVRRRRELRRARVVAAVVGVAFLISVVLGYEAWKQRGLAQRQKLEAERLAHGRPTADCRGSCLPSNIRLGRLRPAIARGLRSDVRAAVGCLTPSERGNPVCTCPLPPSHVARPEAVSPGHSYRSHFVGVLPCTRFSQPGLLGSGLYG